MESFAITYNHRRQDLLTFQVMNRNYYQRREEIDGWHKINFLDLNQKSAKHIENMQSTREQLAEYKKKYK